jgi:hypothetical protein
MGWVFHHGGTVDLARPLAATKGVLRDGNVGAGHTGREQRPQVPPPDPHALPSSLCSCLLVEWHSRER